MNSGLTLAIVAGSLLLQWPDGCQLEWSTSVDGPFEPLDTAAPVRNAEGWSWSTGAYYPQCFFRLSDTFELVVSWPRSLGELYQCAWGNASGQYDNSSYCYVTNSGPDSFRVSVPSGPPWYLSVRPIKLVPVIKQGVVVQVDKVPGPWMGEQFYPAGSYVSTFLPPLDTSTNAP